MEGEWGGGGLFEKGALFNLAERMTGSTKRKGRNRLELPCPTTCFGPGL